MRGPRRPKPPRNPKVGKNPGFLKKTSPVGFLGFLVFFVFFVFFYICPEEEVFRVFQFQEYF